MIEAVVLLASDHSLVGRFRFRAVPRKGEEITVPSPGAPQDAAHYDVEEVGHLGIPTDDGDIVWPEIVLKVTEIT